MAQLWMDGFDHYGSDKFAMLEGPWANFLFAPEISLASPPGGSRTGPFSLRLAQTNSFNAFETSARRVLGGDFDEIFGGFGMFLEQIPEGSETVFPVQFQDNGGTKIATLSVRGDGGMMIRAGSHTGTVLGQTTGPVVQAGTQHHLEMRILRDNVAGIFELRVDGIEVLNVVALDLGANDIAQIVTGVSTPIAISQDPDIMYIDDMIWRDTTGAVNNGFEGDLRVAALQPIANGVNQGWAKRSIQKLGVGVMDFLDPVDQDMAISYADNAVFELGSDDFTIEGIVRLADALGVDKRITLFSKWREAGDLRSWRLILEGSNLSGNLIFQTSTDGTAGDVIDVHAFPLAAIPDRHIHLAVSREAGVSKLFIDGKQAGLNQADARVYDNNAASLFVNGDQLTDNTTNNGNSLDGWMDGVRLTVGVARYTANFAPPTAALPSDVGGDALFASVELLLNFDDVDNTDQSGNAFVGTLINAPSILFPDDDEAFETINSLTPEDHDFVEASLLAAVGTLTFTGQPLDTETVTLGAVTYTFLTIFVDAANNILIGADAAASMENLQNAINLGAGIGVTYGTGTVLNPDATLSDLPGLQKLATATIAGAAGNALASTETLTNGAWSAATLLGGLDIPTNSEFVLSALPPDATGVRAVAPVSRSFKTDAGASELTMSFVVVSGEAEAGDPHPVTLSPRYYEDTIEVDPKTAGNLTVSSVNGSRIRLDRTT